VRSGGIGGGINGKIRRRSAIKQQIMIEPFGLDIQAVVVV